MKCPECGNENIEGALFCDECGSKMAEGEILVMEETPETSEAPAAAGMVLVLKDSGEEIELPEGDEFIIGREDPVSEVFPEIDLTPHGGEEGGVSRSHCKIIKQGDGYKIEDLESTNLTFVNKKKLEPHQPEPLNDGDEIRLGKVVLIFKAKD
ncbi:MAG: FHA domain-containing protein [Deltaproteobacteria bacterium]|nr:MAG: FHA domain-containing protein [Deltaproteobacteria bacterium]